MNERPPLVIGLGSPHGDDQAGWAIVDCLWRRGVSRARRAHDGVELLLAMEGQDEVVLVDASAPSGAPGRVRAFAWPCAELANERLLSTHGLGLLEALRVAEALGCLPRRVTVIAIEAEAAAPAAAVSGVVARAIDNLAEQLLKGEVPPCMKPH